MIASPPKPATTPEPSVMLASGAEVLVRPVVPNDSDALAASLARLSAHSRFQRFFTAVPTLSQAQLAYLTRIDHHNHEALAAVDPATGEIIGVARFVRSRTRQHSAEIAVTIADDWQHRGLGTELLRRLIQRAAAEGITEFTAEFLSENPAMLALLRHGGHVTTEIHGTTTTATIGLRR